MAIRFGSSDDYDLLSGQFALAAVGKVSQENIFTGIMTSDRKLMASREGSK